MPMGPMRLLDEVGIDVAQHVAQTLAAQFSDRMATPAVLARMIEAGLLGRKCGRGFYLHEERKEAKTNPVSPLCRDQRPLPFDSEELQERMSLLMVNEAARCLEEQIVSEPADVDFGMIMGTGFAPFRGGPLRYADAEGAAVLTNVMDCWRTEARHNSGHAPCCAAWLPRGVFSTRIKETDMIDKSSTAVHTGRAETRRCAHTDRYFKDVRGTTRGTRTHGSRPRIRTRHAFAGDLFMGSFDLSGIRPFPTQTAEDRDQGDVFLGPLESFLRDRVDPDEIDRTGEIPQHVIDGLAKLGAFGIKISPEYGGLGLSQTNYCRAAMLLGGYCGNLTALLSAHQSIGVPQPLILFGTEEQKRKYLPRVARGEISAFALRRPTSAPILRR